MRAHAGTILQHGAIVIDWDGRLQAGSMGLESDASLRPQITTLSDELGRPVERPTLEKKLFEAFSSEFAIEFEQSEPSDAETDRERQLEASLLIVA